MYSAYGQSATLADCALKRGSERSEDAEASPKQYSLLSTRSPAWFATLYAPFWSDGLSLGHAQTLVLVTS